MIAKMPDDLQNINTSDWAKGKSDKLINALVKAVGTGRSQVKRKKSRGIGDSRPLPGQQDRAPIPIAFEKVMDKIDFVAKVVELKRWEAEDQEELSPFRGEKVDGTGRRSGTVQDSYRDALATYIMDKFKHDPDLAEAARTYAMAKQADHLRELQGAGEDHPATMRQLHNKTNSQVGRQIRTSMQKLEVGRLVKFVIKGWWK
jgi:hypothetical protein